MLPTPAHTHTHNADVDYAYVARRLRNGPINNSALSKQSFAPGTHTHGTVQSLPRSLCVCVRLCLRSLSCSLCVLPTVLLHAPVRRAVRKTHRKWASINCLPHPPDQPTSQHFTHAHGGRNHGAEIRKNTRTRTHISAHRAPRCCHGLGCAYQRCGCLLPPASQPRPIYWHVLGIGSRMLCGAEHPRFRVSVGVFLCVIAAGRGIFGVISKTTRKTRVRTSCGSFTFIFMLSPSAHTTHTHTPAHIVAPRCV